MRITRKGVGGLMVIFVIITAFTSEVFGIKLSDFPLAALLLLTIVGSVLAGPI